MAFADGEQANDITNLNTAGVDNGSGGYEKKDL